MKSDMRIDVYPNVFSACDSDGRVQDIFPPTSLVSVILWPSTLNIHLRR